MTFFPVFFFLILVACFSGIPVLVESSCSPPLPPSATSCKATSSVSGVSLRRRFPPTGDSVADTEDAVSLGRFLSVKKGKKTVRLKLVYYGAARLTAVKLKSYKDLVQHNKQHHMEEMFSSSHLIGHTIGFHSLTQIA